MSVASRLPIVAVIVTLLILPFHHTKHAKTFKVRCVPGTAIKPVPTARRLGVQGKMCKPVIFRHVIRP